MRVPSGLSRAEQETLFRASADDKFWDFYTRDPKFKRLLEKRGYTVREDHQGFWAAKIPLSALTVRSAVQQRRPMTEEAREAARKRLFKLREPTAVGEIGTSNIQDDLEPVQDGVEAILA